MKILGIPRGTRHWLESQACHVTESEASTIVHGPGSENWRALVERLLLDFVGVPQDPAELDRILSWRIRNDAAVLSALAWYRKLSVARELVEMPGLIQAERLSWLQASPHALTAEACVHIVPRIQRRTFELARRRPISRDIFARAQVLMLVTEREACDVVDYWDSRVHVSYDGMHRRRLELDHAFVEQQFLTQCTALWSHVRRLHDEAFG